MIYFILSAAALITGLACCLLHAAECRAYDRGRFRRMAEESREKIQPPTP